MIVSHNIAVILLHVLALILAVAAAFSSRVSVEGRRIRLWHLGWLAVAVLVLINFLADLGAFS
jgi:hypothetical protein